MTLRLADDQAALLEAMARVDEVSVSEAIRAAIDAQLAARRADPDFQLRLHRLIEVNQRWLEQLAG